MSLQDNKFSKSNTHTHTAKKKKKKKGQCRLPLLFCRKWRCWSRFAPSDRTLLCIRSLSFTASSLTITFPRINGDLLHHPRHSRAANLPSTRHLHSSRASRVFQSNHNSRHHSARPRRVKAMAYKRSSVLVGLPDQDRGWEEVQAKTFTKW